MEEKVIDKLWREFHEQVLHSVPKDTVQFTEMRRAFYSGMIAMFSYLVNMPEDGDEPTEQDLANMDQLSDDIAEWAAKEFLNMTEQELNS